MKKISVLLPGHSSCCQSSFFHVSFENLTARQNIKLLQVDRFVFSRYLSSGGGQCIAYFKQKKLDDRSCDRLAKRAQCR